MGVPFGQLVSKRITVKDGVEVVHYEDGSVIVRHRFGTASTMLSPSEKLTMVNALTWEPNTRPGQIGDEDGE